MSESTEYLSKFYDEKDPDPAWDMIAEYLQQWDYEESVTHWLTKGDGKLYENNAGHCSCNGFEGQFNPVESNRATVELMLEKLEARRELGRIGTFDDEEEAALREVIAWLDDNKL